MTMDLFEAADPGNLAENVAEGAVLLRRFARGRAGQLLATIDSVLQKSPLRNMRTPGGSRMAVAMSNCGSLGWISDHRGYRYAAIDPLIDRPWPAMPALFGELAARAASLAGYPGFEADACLINRYEPGVGLSLHQDRDEQDYAAPIVSVSLGVPAVFLFGGDKRSDKPRAIPLDHGDVVVWGRPARLRFHGVRPLKPGTHSLTGPYRYNLTLRRAGK